MPRRRTAIMALVANPFAGLHVPALQAAMDDLKPLGLMMAQRLIAALGGRDGIDGYGKGAIVGGRGEAEHGALWHVPGGYVMRELLGESRAIVPSAMKVGPMGAMPDGPRDDEIVFVLAMPRGGRVHSRMGGLEVWQVKGEDGLR